MSVDSVGRTPSIRSRLLLVVNLPLAALVVIFLVYDYSRELAQRLEDKRIALEEEAKTLSSAVLQLQKHEAGGVQKHIDEVCSQMQDAQSPGHHIAVELEGKTFQAEAHHRASPQILVAMQEAARLSRRHGSSTMAELVVGSFERDGAIVYVSESVENLRRSVVGDILRHLAGFVMLACVAAVVVNVVLSRIVAKPLEILVQTVQQIGKGRLGIQAQSLRSAELNYLASEINAMSMSLAETDRDRKSQMEKARDIQRNLLPRNTDAPGICVAHLFYPANDVGGDYYDILPLTDGAWLFCVSDVMGHGVPAAMTAAMLKTLLLQAAERSTSPAEMLGFINERFIALRIVGDFVTMMLVRVSPKSGTLEYASAGHETAWLLAPDGSTCELTSTGMILGVEPEASWDDVEMKVATGYRLLMTTDGVSETLDAAGSMFGHDRLAGLLVESRQCPVDQAAPQINEALKLFRGISPQNDDVTIILLEMTDACLPIDDGREFAHELVANAPVERA